jgi:type IV pilus assembly protein PilA
MKPQAGAADLAAGTVPTDPITWVCAVDDADSDKYVPSNCRI